MRAISDRCICNFCQLDWRYPNEWSGTVCVCVVCVCKQMRTHAHTHNAYSYELSTSLSHDKRPLVLSICTNRSLSLVACKHASFHSSSKRPTQQTVDLCVPIIEFVKFIVNSRAHSRWLSWSHSYWINLYTIGFSWIQLSVSSLLLSTGMHPWDLCVFLSELSHWIQDISSTVTINK